MSEQELTSIVIVGHVDHGKSTFIGRLLVDTNNLSPDRLAEIKKASEEHGRKLEYAYVTDQFEEEREKNITIDTSQTFLKIGERHFLIIDAPGHKEYLKNMITGATQAKNGIIMLDVNEGVREQTEKHARILKLLGIQRVAVFINKMDLKDYSEAVFNQYAAELEKLMRDWGIPATNIIPISAYNGENVASRSTKMAWYTGPTALDYLNACGQADAVRAPQKLRMPVQIVYDVDGRHLVMGRVEQGSVSAGQTLTLFPTGRSVTVSEVLKYHESVKSAEEGECVALAFSGTDGFERGQVLTDQPGLKPAAHVAVHAFWASSEPLKVGDEIIVECRTQSAPFVVERVSDEIEQRGISQLGTGDVGQVTLKPRSAMLVDPESVGTALSRLVFHKNGQVAGCGVASHVE